jgi:hypothetical protein
MAPPRSFGLRYFTHRHAATYITLRAGNSRKGLGSLHDVGEAASFSLWLQLFLGGLGHGNPVQQIARIARWCTV